MAKTQGLAITVGVTGASGALYAQTILRLLDADARVFLVFIVVIFGCMVMFEIFV